MTATKGKQRAKKARAILRKNYDQNDLESSAVDMLADLMHLAAQNRFDFDNCRRIAVGHFEEERREDKR